MANYDIITVASGDTFSKSISDGETWSNKLIDIRADGAGYSITASADNWEMKNIGIRGQWDHDPGSQQVVVKVPSSGATGLVQNCYFGDGATSSAADPGGLFVHTDHAGTLTIDGFNVQGMPDNGIYASSPGYDGDGTGGQGEVHIKNSYAANCGSSGFRLGSTDSTIENCSMWNNDRGLWCLFQHIEATNCDMGTNGTDVRVGSNSQESGGPYGELTVDNCRYGSTDVVRSQNAIYGNSSGTAGHRGPSDVGAPADPDEAASGTTSSGGSGGDQDFDVITVAPNDTYSVRLGNGDSLENVIIDITNSGAGYDIQAKGNGWAIKNVGIRGAWDHSPPSSPFRIMVPSSNGTATIENLYMGDGVAGSFSPNAEPTGIYSYWDHAGTVTIRNVNIQGFPDNGMYLSACGNGSSHPNPGHGGEYHIEDCYAANNQVSHYRLGTDGSYVKNSVGWGGAHRGYWGYYEDTEVIDCDFGDNGSYDVKLGTGPWNKADHASVTLTNTYFDTKGTSASTNTFYGSSAGSPTHRSPSSLGCPTTAEEAASGGSSDGTEQKPFGVSTETPTIGDTTATLRGQLTGLGGSSSADCYFEYRKVESAPDSGGDGGGGSTGPEEYDTITVPAGEMFTYSLDDGETWENKIIDITADGANAHIDMTGKNMTVRDIGFKGEGSRIGDTNYHIGIADRSSSGTSVVENVYMGDGDDGVDHKDGFAAVFVYPSHAGVAKFRNVYIEDFTDNGLYGSDPGHTAVSSAGGEVHVIDSFAGNCTAANIRLGTDGSYVKNCCIWGGPHRGYWQYFEHSKIIDTHIGGMADPDRSIHIGGSAYEKMRYAETTVENSYFDGYTLHTSDNEIHGSSKGTPQKFIPEGTPETPEEAATGQH